MQKRTTNTASKYLDTDLFLRDSPETRVPFVWMGRRGTAVYAPMCLTRRRKSKSWKPNKREFRGVSGQHTRHNLSLLNHPVRVLVFPLSRLPNFGGQSQGTRAQTRRQIHPVAVVLRAESRGKQIWSWCVLRTLTKCITTNGPRRPITGKGSGGKTRSHRGSTVGFSTRIDETLVGSSRTSVPVLRRWEIAHSKIWLIHRMASCLYALPCAGWCEV